MFRFVYQDLACSFAQSAYTSGPVLRREGRAALAVKGATSTWASDAGEAGEKGGGQREDLKEKCGDQMFSVFSTHYCGSIAE